MCSFFRNRSLLILGLFLIPIHLTAQNFVINQDIDPGLHDGSMALGDIDGDGDPDVVINGIDNFGNSQLMVYRNDAGVLSFSHHPNGLDGGFTLQYNSACELVDLRNEGFPTLYAAGNNDAWTFKNSSGIFSPMDSVGNPTSLYTSSFFGDINGDSFVDKFEIGEDFASDSRCFSFINDQLGNLTPLRQPVGNGVGLKFGSVVLVDCNNDNKLELILSGQFSSSPLDLRLRKYIIDDWGEYVGLQELLAPFTGLRDSSIVAGDIDNDGLIDLAVIGRDSTGINDRFIIYKNNNGNFSIAQQPMGVSTGIHLGGLSFGDYDNDGDLDLALTGNDNLMLWRNENGSFSMHQNLSSTVKGLMNSRVQLVDLDMDGNQEILCYGIAEGGMTSKFFVLKNQTPVDNKAPSRPLKPLAYGVGGFWRMEWDASNDDHTPRKLLRYQIMIGTNSGGQDKCSSYLYRPAGQATVGNVIMVTSSRPYYQTKISTNQRVFWKVKAIDTAVQESKWSFEYLAGNQTGPYYVDAVNGNDLHPGTTNFPFKTIGRAINAVASISCKSPRIFVKSGIYNEFLTLNFSTASNFIHISGLGTDKPVVGGSGSGNGISISSTSAVIISNLIVTRFNTGLLIPNSTSLQIKNCVFRSNSIGIYAMSTAQNVVITSNTFQRSLNPALLSDTKQMMISKNRFLNQMTSSAIQLRFIANSNRVSDNFFSSNLFAIKLTNGITANIIISNRFYKSLQDSVVFNVAGAGNVIAGNLFHSASRYAINIDSTPGSVCYNNTVVKSFASGIRLYNTSASILKNNILLSNGKNFGDFGIFAGASTLMQFANNCYWGNFNGPTNSTTGKTSSNEILQDPLLNPADEYSISAASSPAVEAGLIITPQIRATFGLAPDLGWKESPFIRNSGPFFVNKSMGNDLNDGTLGAPFNSIQKAVDALGIGFPAITSATAYIAPGTYSERVRFKPNTSGQYITVKALSNNNPPVMDGNMVMTNAFFLSNTKNVIIQKMSFKKYMDGVITIKGVSPSNIIRNCLFESNEGLNSQYRPVIRLLQGAQYTVISNNDFRRNMSGVGVYILSSKMNWIGMNRFHTNLTGLCNLYGNSNTYFRNDLVASNNNALMRLTDSGESPGTIVVSNSFVGNRKGVGVSIWNGYKCILQDNTFERLSNGVAESFANINLSRNLFRSNLVAAVRLGSYYGVSTGGSIRSNSFFGCGNGVILYTNAHSLPVDKNLFVDTSVNAVVIKGISAYPIRVANNTFIRSGKSAIRLNGVGSARFFNNIFLSNGLSSGGYGIETTNVGSSLSAYNLFYGNTSGPFSSGVMVGSDNEFAQSPMLGPDFRITAALSGAVDMGTNIGYPYFASKPDTGCYESSFTGIVKPTKPTGLICTSLSSNALFLRWSDVLQEEGYRLLVGTNGTTNSIIQKVTLPQDSISYTFTGMQPNRTRYFWLDATNQRGKSGLTAAVLGTSLAGNPFVVSTNLENFVYLHPGFSFTNLSAVSAVPSVRYAWNKSSSYTVTNSDALWGSAAKSIVAAEEGTYYLHVRSVNSFGQLSYQRRYGPFKYYLEYTGAFSAEVSKPRIEPGLMEYSVIRNSTKLTNVYTGSNMSDGKLFVCEILSGIASLDDGTNGRSVKPCMNGDVQFNLRGNVINLVRLRLYWLEDRDVGFDVEVLVSPAMDLDETRDAVIYKNVLSQDAGEVLDIYINADVADLVEVQIIDIQAKKRVRTLKVDGRYLAHLVYDLKNENGQSLPPGSYGVLLKATGWSRQLKFHIK